MADDASFVRAQDKDSMPLLAHLEELRKFPSLGYSSVFSRAGLMLTGFSV
jgi:hypothetical protein